MPYLQELSTPQIDEAITAACDKHVPLTVTIRDSGRWITLRSRFLRVDQGHILIEYPQVEEGQPPHEFAPADKIGITFKLKHYKHITMVTTVGPRTMKLPDGTDAHVLCVCCPLKMHRAQRRAYLRVDIPPNRVVRVSFWQGGVEAEPTGGPEDDPVWSGRVSNLSAGGFQVVADAALAETLETGDFIGVHISFGAGSDWVRADAQFRHVQVTGESCLLGFQFVGLEQTPQGRKTLTSISQTVAELRRDAERWSRVQESRAARD